jgi:hypothetical protein
LELLKNLLLMLFQLLEMAFPRFHACFTRRADKVTKMPILVWLEKLTSYLVL